MKPISLLLTIVSITAWCGVALGQDEPALSADPGPPELDVDTDLPVGPLMLGSFGLVLVGVGAGFGWQAKQEHEDWQDARDAGDPAGRMNDLADDVKAHSITANVLMFSGAGLVVISVILLLLGGEDDADAEQTATASIRWSPDVGPGRAGVVVQF